MRALRTGPALVAIAILSALSIVVWVLNVSHDHDVDVLKALGYVQ